jgi:hypothetical protein
MSNPKSGGTGLRRFYLADFARQTKAWYKGLSFRKGHFEKDPPAQWSTRRQASREAARARTRSGKGLL